MTNRTDIDQAHRQGWAAFVTDTPRGACPYPDSDPEMRDAWLSSFDKAASQPEPSFA